MDHSHHDMHGGHDEHLAHNSHADHEAHVEHIVTNSTTTMENVISSATHSGHGVHKMMQMTFHGGYSEVVLFDWWRFNSIGGLIGSMVAIFVLAVLYEGLKYYREHLFWKIYNSLHYQAVQPPEVKATSSDDPQVVHMVGGIIRKQPPSMFSKFNALQTVLHGVQVTASYLLMLIFMTYNSWLCLAVVVGAACGNFLFGWKKSVVVDVTEHCH